MTIVACAFCHRLATRDDAIQEGWQPSFWYDETTRCDEPVCPPCAARNLTDLNDDAIIKPRPPIALN